MSKGAPIGNRFWELRSKHGRDKLFATPELMWEAAKEYFEWCQDNPLMEAQIVKSPEHKTTETPIQNPDTKKTTKVKTKTTKPYSIAELPKMRPFTMQGLCSYLEVNTVYFNEFADNLKGKDDELSKDFSQIVTRIRETIYQQKFEGASAGFLNPNIIARDLGLIDKSDKTINGEMTVKQITGMEIK